MIDAYTIGVTLALEDGVSAGLAEIGRELALLDDAIRTTSADLDRLRNANVGLDVSPSIDEATQLLRQTERAASQLPRAAAIPRVQNAVSPQDAPDTDVSVPLPSSPNYSKGVETQGLPPVPVTAAPSTPTERQSEAHTVPSAPATIPRAPISVIVGAAATEQPASDDRAAPPQPPSAPPSPSVPTRATLRNLIVLGERSMPQSPTEAVGLGARPGHPGQDTPPANVFAAGPAAPLADRPALTESSPAGVRADLNPFRSDDWQHPNIVTTYQKPSTNDQSFSPYRAAPQDGPIQNDNRRPAAPRATAPPVAVANQPVSVPTPLAAMPSVAPTARSGSDAPMKGDVYLDGSRLGRWIADRLGRDASRPPSGTTGFDPRLGLAWPGAAVGP